MIVLNRAMMVKRGRLLTSLALFAIARRSSLDDLSASTYCSYDYLGFQSLMVAFIIRLSRPRAVCLIARPVEISLLMYPESCYESD